MVKEERPLQFFGAIAGIFFIAGQAFGIPVVLQFIATGLVPRLPTAVLSTGVILLSFLALVCGLILDTVTRGRREMKRLAYLSSPAVTSRHEWQPIRAAASDVLVRPTYFVESGPTPAIPVRTPVFEETVPG